MPMPKLVSGVDPTRAAVWGVATEHVHEIVSGSPFGRGKDSKYP
jgi:hypothetical protein